MGGASGVGPHGTGMSVPMTLIEDAERSFPWGSGCTVRTQTGVPLLLAPCIATGQVHFVMHDVVKRSGRKTCKDTRSKIKHVVPALVLYQKILAHAGRTSTGSSRVETHSPHTGDANNTNLPISTTYFNLFATAPAQNQAFEALATVSSGACRDGGAHADRFLVVVCLRLLAKPNVQQPFTSSKLGTTM